MIDAQLATTRYDRTCTVGYAYLLLSMAVLIFVVEICLAVVFCHFKCKRLVRGALIDVKTVLVFRHLICLAVICDF